MNVKVDFNVSVGKIKPQHCANNGPLVVSARRREAISKPIKRQESLMQEHMMHPNG